MRPSRVLPLMALSASPASAWAQYLYIDTDGDGVHTDADRLSAAGPTTLVLYLDTTHDADGSLQSCNSHTPELVGVDLDPLGFFSYQVLLKADGGTVMFGAYADSQGWGAPSADLDDVDELEVTRLSPALGDVAPPGLYELGRVDVTVVSGAPAIGVSATTDLDPFGLTLF